MSQYDGLEPEADAAVGRLFTGDRGYSNPTFDTNERTCWNGHIISEADDELDSCRECAQEQK